MRVQGSRCRTCCRMAPAHDPKRQQVTSPARDKRLRAQRDTKYYAPSERHQVTSPSTLPRLRATHHHRERHLFIDNLLVQIHLIIVMIGWTGLAPWEFEIPFPGSLTSTFPYFPNVNLAILGPVTRPTVCNTVGTSGGSYWAIP